MDKSNWRHSYTWRDRLTEPALKPIGWFVWIISLPIRFGNWLAEKVWNS